MAIERIESPGLAHYSYLVSDDIDAVVIDPRRDVDVYLDRLAARRLRLVAVLETHRHEDFASGAAELARATGAPVLHGAGLPWGFGQDAVEGREIPLGQARLHAIATPGHTVEGVSWVLFEGGHATPLAVFTGDTLMAGAVGRVDLYGRMRAEANARELYRSLHARILPLGDGVAVYPAHGSGSVCGADVADRPVTTIGYERQVNPWLTMSEAQFVAAKRAEPHLVPPWFLRMERWNLEGPPPLAWVPRMRAMAPTDVEASLGAGARVLDLRAPSAFAAGHLPGALSIPRSGLGAWGGWAIPEDRDLTLVLPEDTDVDAVAADFARLGVDRVVGYLAPAWEAWVAEGRSASTLGAILPGELARRRARGWEPLVLDVRTPEEWAEGALPGARFVFLGDLPARLGEIPQDRPVVVACSTGARASVAASLLRAAGHPDVSNLMGGMTAARALGWNLPAAASSAIEEALSRSPHAHVRTRVLETV